MPDTSKFIQIAVLLFTAALLILAALGTLESAENNRLCLPVDGNLGSLSISWYYPDCEEMISGADVIAVATVSEKFGVWGTADGKKPPRNELCSAGIYTRYLFEEVDVLKGNVSSLSVRAPGGEIDGYSLNASPVPEFEIGDRVLLLLSDNFDADGNSLEWYHLGEPNVFTQTENGTFTNPYYGELTIESL